MTSKVLHRNLRIKYFEKYQYLAKKIARQRYEKFHGHYEKDDITNELLLALWKLTNKINPMRGEGEITNLVLISLKREAMRLFPDPSKENKYHKKYDRYRVPVEDLNISTDLGYNLEVLPSDLDPVLKEVAKLKIDGYDNVEIMKKMGIKHGKFYKLLKKLRNILEKEVVQYAVSR